jgi:dihydropteroate synthase
MGLQFPTRLNLPGRTLELGASPLIMGIVNVTPDSFSDGGEHFGVRQAVEHAWRLDREGADWLDIGGESTRPGATPVPLDEELRRVIPVIQALSGKTDKTISIDTYKPEVARQAIEAGAEVMNDVTGFRDPAMIELAAQTDVACVVMHMRGTPADMMEQTNYTDVVADLVDYFEQRIDQLIAAGVDRQRIIIDPGIGFAKRRADNLRLIHRIDELAVLGRPIMLGASRKRIIGEITERSEDGRLYGTLATSVWGYLRGVHLLRVHDVGPTRDALAMTRAIDQEGRK